MATSDWELLRNHESFELVKKDYEVRHGRMPSTEHAREIAAPFAHARSYFASARGADQTVRPLLLYYGVVSLSRGLALTLFWNRRESTLAQAHGLSNKEWHDELSRPNPDFASLRVTTNEIGSFQDLIAATKGRSLLKSNSTEVNYSVSEDPVPPGSEYTLGDLMARIPNLQDNHRRWRGFSLCVGVSGINSDIDTQTFQLRRDKKIDRAYCDAIFAGSSFSFASETADYFAYSGKKGSPRPGITDDISYAHFGIGDLSLAAMYPAGPNLSKIATLFMLSYTLGMLVRYYPTQWTALTRAQIGDAALPTITAAIDWIETEYPRQVTDFLRETPT